MRKFIICNTNWCYCDDIEFTCKDGEDPETIAQAILESHGYSEFCDDNGFYSYDFELEEVYDD
ncbi:Uncharacterised protein [Streptococcus pyogenes]|nr:Uncharacterised protein [Streptococcus pyogenes]VED83874.1 Uncharacterised protein [Streptococcus pyogenes]VGS58058.1 Uncharacterised protein [Streptococcus pyogenes]